LEDTIQILNYTKPGEDNRYLPIFLDELRVYDVGLNSIEVNDLYEFREEADTVDKIEGVNLAFADDAIHVSWDADDAATGYRVYRSINAGNTYLEVANIEDGDSTTYLDTEYIPDREMLYYVVGYNDMFVAEDSDTKSLTVPTISEEPATGSWDAPIAYWKFNGDVEDYSGNEQHGTIVGDVSYVQGFAGPNGGQAIKSEGTLDDAGYVDLGKDTEDAIHDITTDFSIAFWYKGDTTNVPGGTWFKPVISDGGAFSVVLMKNDDEEVQFRPDWNFYGLASKDSGDTWIEATWDTYVYQWPPSIDDNNQSWHHIVFTYSQSESILYNYLDGELNYKTWAIIDDDIFNKNDTIRSIFILGDPRDPRYLPVNLDELRIYDYGLTSSDVTSLYEYEPIGDPIDAVSNFNGEYTDPSITLTWDEAANATGYRISRSINNGNTFETDFANITDGTTTQFVDEATDIPEDRDIIMYYINAYNDVNVSENSDTIMVDRTVSVNVSSMETTSIYPNPVNEYVNITSPELIQTIEVYNIIGNKVMTSNPAKSEYRLNVQSLPAGTYFIKVSSASGAALKKITIVKQ
ncbi:MAG: T9SS type A sorting domain-containing protein, partial [Bacteroidetes bacterium]|nr:T9SS type A sorting domain-containing protein [Bacteroidota bacterium]